MASFSSIINMPWAKLVAILTVLGMGWVAAGHVWGASQQIAKNTDAALSHDEQLTVLREIHTAQEQREAEEAAVKREQRSACAQGRMNPDWCWSNGYETPAERR